LARFISTSSFQLRLYSVTAHLIQYQLNRNSSFWLPALHTTSIINPPNISPTTVSPLFPLSIPRSDYYYFLPFPIIVINTFPFSCLFFLLLFLFSVQLVPLRSKVCNLIYFTISASQHDFFSSPHHFPINLHLVKFFFPLLLLFPFSFLLLFCFLLCYIFFPHIHQQSSIDRSCHLLKTSLFRRTHSRLIKTLFTSLQPFFPGISSLGYTTVPD